MQLSHYGLNYIFPLNASSHVGILQDDKNLVF